MSNINDLYKESGIQPGGFDRDPKKDRKNRTGGKGSSYLISIVVSVIIFAGIYLYLQSDSGRHSGLSIRNSAIFIVGLVYVVNYLIKVIIRVFNSNKD